MTSRSKMFVGILLILAMELIDITVLNNILSDIAHSFAISPFDAKLAITSYTITFGVFLPISVWVSDRFGYYTPLIFALVGFISSSVMCGLSVNLWMLVVFRLLQGFFAALLLPIAQSTMIRLAESMVEVSARIGMYTVGAAAIGQLIGAFLTQYVSWRLVFFLNVPIGLIGMYLIIRYYDVPFEKVKTKLDWIGFLVVGASIGSLFVLSNIVADQHVAIYIKILLLVVPIVASGLYFTNLKKIANPIINFHLFKKADYTIMSLIKFINKLSLYWLFFALPIYLYIYIGFPMTQVAVVMVTVAAQAGFLVNVLQLGLQTMWD